MLGIFSFLSSQAWTPTHHDGSSKATQPKRWLRGPTSATGKQDIVFTAHIPSWCRTHPSSRLTCLSWTHSLGTVVEVHRTGPRPSLPVVTLWASYLTLLGLGFLIYKIWMIIGLNQLTYVRCLEWCLAHSKHILAAIIILRPVLYCVHFNLLAPNIFFSFPFFFFGITVGHSGFYSPNQG